MFTFDPIVLTTSILLPETTHKVEKEAFLMPQKVMADRKLKNVKIKHIVRSIHLSHNSESKTIISNIKAYIKHYSTIDFLKRI